MSLLRQVTTPDNSIIKLWTKFFCLISIGGEGISSMITAILIALVAIGSVAFHLTSPWWWTHVASNWGKELPLVHRWVYDYGVPGAADDFIPQNMSPNDVPMAKKGRKSSPSRKA